MQEPVSVCVRAFMCQQSVVVAAANHAESAKVRRARECVFMWKSMHLGVTPVLQTTLMQLVAMTAALNPAAIISAATGMVIRARESCCFGLL